VSPWHKGARVLHLPYQTPYVRKLTPPPFHIVNGSPIPNDLNFNWLRRQNDFSFFDILHIHFIDFDTPEDVAYVLEKCAQEKKKIIYTAHNICPMYDDSEEFYQKKVELICSHADALVALTPSGGQALLEKLNAPSLQSRLAVQPLGWHVDPSHPKWGRAGSSKETIQYAIYGSFRHNREFYSPILNWYYSLRGTNAHLNIFALPVNPCDIETEKPHVAETVSFIQSDPARMSLRIFPHLSDNQIIDLLSGCDVLLMPYLWGSHSGQLEQAFDMNLLPVSSDVGYYKDQWRQVQSYVPEPVWFNWSDGNIYNYGSRLTEALQTAQAQALRHKKGPREKFRQYRLQEYQDMLQFHARLYGEV